MSEHNVPPQSAEASGEDRDLDDLSEDELGQMLAEAERALRDIRAELHERRVLAHAGLDLEMPRQDLNEARGRWTHFFDFVRQLSAQREAASSDR
ncbi:MAG: hypothetical protein WBA72_09805 [Ornithinimicrobium sp.]